MTESAEPHRLYHASGFVPISGVSIIIHADRTAYKRTWRQRLFSRPWRPFETHFCVESTLGNRVMIIADTYHCTQSTFARLKEHCGYQEKPLTVRDGTSTPNLIADRVLATKGE